MSLGRSSVACWMKPTMSNWVTAAGMVCAPVGAVSAAAMMAATKAHPTRSLPESDRGRCVGAVGAFITVSFQVQERPSRSTTIENLDSGRQSVISGTCRRGFMAYARPGFPRHGGGGEHPRHPGGEGY